MSWIIAAIFVPIPLFHLWLHALLPWWRKIPWLIYVLMAMAWVMAIIFLPMIDELSPTVFYPNIGLQFLGSILMLVGFVMICLSFAALGLIRFISLPILLPDITPRVRISSGIFKMLPHPAYIGFVIMLVGNFLSSGKVYLAGVMLYGLVTMPLVIFFEEQELAQRITT